MEEQLQNNITNIKGKINLLTRIIEQIELILNTKITESQKIKVQSLLKKIETYHLKNVNLSLKFDDCSIVCPNT